MAVEPSACPSLTRQSEYDFGDTAGAAPMVKITLGHGFIPPGIHAGGLSTRMSPSCRCTPKDHRRSGGQAVGGVRGGLCSPAEGILPAPESAHAIRATIDEALECRRTGEPKSILFCLSGHGHFDLLAYDAYLHGELQDVEN